MKLTLEDIKKIIPHRDPFLFLDEIIELETLNYAIGKKQVKKDEFYFKGHFPGKPVVPTTLSTFPLKVRNMAIPLSFSKSP